MATAQADAAGVLCGALYGAPQCNISMVAMQCCVCTLSAAELR
jgi:hypothetical protein